MDLDVKDILDFLRAAARSVGAEVTSPWFYQQLGLVLAAGGIAFAVARSVGARVEMSSLASKWPVPLRLFMRTLVGSAAAATFALLMPGRPCKARSTVPIDTFASSAILCMPLRFISSCRGGHFAAYEVLQSFGPAS